MVNALFAAPITHLRMKSCSITDSKFIEMLRAFSGTLQVVELVDAAVWVWHDSVTEMFPVLGCLRDDLHLHKLVLDGEGVGWKHYDGPPGTTVTTGRVWTGQQQIQAGLDILLGFEGYGWDDDYDDVSREEQIRREELEVQGITYSQHEDHMDYTEYLEFKTEQERHLERDKRYHAKVKALKVRAKEAMARVETGEFDT